MNFIVFAYMHTMRDRLLNICFYAYKLFLFINVQCMLTTLNLYIANLNCHFIIMLTLTCVIECHFKLKHTL